MRRVVLAAIAAAALLLTACTPDVTVENVPGEPATTSGIAVSGRGEVYGTPDTLQMTFGVSVLRRTVQKAVDDAAALADGLISSLEASGVAPEDIQTSNYSIHPEYDWRNDERKLLGYRVSNNVVAKVRDIDSAGSVIDDAVAEAGDEIQISGVSFSIEDDTELIAAARDAAWEDARSKAQQLADLAGLELGKAIMIAESVSSTPPVPIYRADFADEMAGAGVSTPIEAGEQQVAVNLEVRFETN
ncbi:MAG: SIMPL domain-containing protein [Actinomycetota bacterium]